MAKTSPPPCELYIVRHAIAAERGDDWPDDDKRPLTEKGIVRFKDGLAGLNWLDVGLDEIFSSPLVRAKQTADLLAAGISGKPPVKLLPALAPGHAPDVVMQQLAQTAKRRRIALVATSLVWENSPRTCSVRSVRSNSAKAVSVESIFRGSPRTGQDHSSGS